MSTSSLNIPSSSSTVKVSVIGTTLDIRGVPTSHFMGPDLKGFETFSVPSQSFLVEHTDKTGSKRNVIFDLGASKDWENDLPKPVVDLVKSWNADLSITKNVPGILTENGVSLNDIESVIWSHAHWDHIGRVSDFPATTSLIVGPELKKKYFPGYPQVPDSPVLSRHFSGRQVTELNLKDFNLEIGGFKALDYFADGSFYILHAPGHAVGHINALARTSSDAFMYLGADSFHHGSEMRPNKHTPLPETIHLSNFTPSMCPGHIFHCIHPATRKEPVPERYREALDLADADPDTTPFMTFSETEEGEGLSVDIEAARSTVSLLQAFDAAPNVMVVAAHDQSLRDVLEYFPKEANGWVEKGWKEKARWRFLEDFAPAMELAKGE